jgi:hypothetical protein
MSSVAEQCRSVLKLPRLISAAPRCPAILGNSTLRSLEDQTSRLSLWIGNISAVHQESYPLSLELLQIASGERVAQATFYFQNDFNNLSGASEEETDEVAELLEETWACIMRLFCVSTLIRQAAPSDTFVKALSMNRY